MLLVSQRSVSSLKIVALSLMLRSKLFLVCAQLESCADIDCPTLSGNCPLPDVGDNPLFWLAASRFQSQLSPEPLSWTVGETPRTSADGKHTEEGLVFYLGQPPTLNLRDDASVTACAIFFDGVAPHLKFNHTENAVNDLTTRGTCDDALTTQCVSDWTRQAANITALFAGDEFTCQRLADSLRKDPPKSCTVVKGSWGMVQARNISGSTMSVPTLLNGCNPTINDTYSATQAYNINGTKSELLTAITPVLTMISSTSSNGTWSTEVHLNCLKLIDDAPPSNSVIPGSSSRLQMPNLTLWAAYCLVMLSCLS